jgi:putative ABC transport system permease protein
MTGLLHDLRYALRQLRKNPGFACTAILILALGIGGRTAIFSVLNPILFEPLPYPHAERLMAIWYAAEDGSRVPQTFHTYQVLAEGNRTFESLAVMKLWQLALNGGFIRL